MVIVEGQLLNVAGFGAWQSAFRNQRSAMLYSEGA